MKSWSVAGAPGYPVRAEDFSILMPIGGARRVIYVRDQVRVLH
jgi:hypothetical protein